MSLDVTALTELPPVLMANVDKAMVYVHVYMCAHKYHRLALGRVGLVRLYYRSI